MILEAGPEGLSARSGRAGRAAGHIPRSGFLDLLTELSDTDAPFRFMLPGSARFAVAVYDASLEERATDPSLPLETG